MVNVIGMGMGMDLLLGRNLLALVGLHAKNSLKIFNKFFEFFDRRRRSARPFVHSDRFAVERIAQIFVAQSGKPAGSAEGVGLLPRWGEQCFTKGAYTQNGLSLRYYPPESFRSRENPKI